MFNRTPVHEIPDTPQVERISLLASDPDRLVKRAFVRMALQGRDQIEGLASLIKPPRSLPHRPQDEVRTSLHHTRHALRLHVGAIPETDFSRMHGNTVQTFAAALIRQLKVTESLVRNIKTGMDPPHTIARPVRLSRLADNRRIHDADQPAFARSWRTQLAHATQATA
ncbi:Uncharacterised protein [Pannonibacter phragmitetus]|uniref:Uncharacterized protein n=1 Tax=Pannonibacter phragmitetus TaxID=121719 RepID=A0A378ZVA0_9HYPH|nr:hypothetical protein [Pannonibacter phragmitetus]SUB01156.1 Uncharacterised protein [Pannonibacter phragmitetus]